MSDLPGLLFFGALLLLVAGEVQSFFDDIPENTLSERIRAVIALRPARVLALALLLAGLFLHLVYEWPW